MHVMYDTKERLIEDVRAIGQTIIDRAEEIVGDWKDIYNYTIVAEISIDTVPQLTWTKQAHVVRTKHRATVIGKKEGEE